MGRRRSQRACASAPSMPSSARGSRELRRRSAGDAEVSAVAQRATTGSEAAPPGERGGRTRGGGRGSTARTSSTGEAQRAERRGDTPARKPDPEAGRMDHHQLGTGRYQVVSARGPGAARRDHTATPGTPRRGRAASPRPERLPGPPPSSPRPHPTACSPPSSVPDTPSSLRRCLCSCGFLVP